MNLLWISFVHGRRVRVGMFNSTSRFASGLAILPSSVCFLELLNRSESIECLRLLRTLQPPLNLQPK
jgi:hypothetical protein